MDKTAAQKNDLLKAASATMHTFVDQIDALQEENNKLRVELEAVKQASAEKVTLQKVASAHPDKINEFVDNLINHHFISEQQREKCATALMENPNNILDIANQAIKSSELPLETGYGIKTASSIEDPNKASNDAWMRCLASYEANY